MKNKNVTGWKYTHPHDKLKYDANCFYEELQVGMKIVGGVALLSFIIFMVAVLVGSLAIIFYDDNSVNLLSNQ